MLCRGGGGGGGAGGGFAAFEFLVDAVDGEEGSVADGVFQVGLVVRVDVEGVGDAGLGDFDAFLVFGGEGSICEGLGFWCATLGTC